MIKHLVTSGCSFSDNFNERWPYFLSEKIGATLYNRGQGSCGNSWISKSEIYQIQQLLDRGIPSDEILAVVMWSGIDRKDLFVSAKEIFEYENLINSDGGSPNPINFLDSQPNNRVNSSENDGYLAGSTSCYFTNKYINEYKRESIKFFCNESLAIESYENFLKLQWYCESKNVKLINLTYTNIFKFPLYNCTNREQETPLTKDLYRNILPLYNMLNFEKWIFYNDFDGLYEYTFDNKLEFYLDKIHPQISAHKYFVDTFLLPELTNRKII